MVKAQVVDLVMQTMDRKQTRTSLSLGLGLDLEEYQEEYQGSR
jgi:hypothetical protein